MPHRTLPALAGHLTVETVLMNVLIEKGVISKEEMRTRLLAAQQRAAQSPASKGGIVVIETMLDALDQEILASKK